MKLFLFICLLIAATVTDDNSVKKKRSPVQLRDQEEKQKTIELNNSESVPDNTRELKEGSDEASGSAEEEDDIITKLEKRVEKLNDKVDHLLFHNHHDLVGVTAHIGLAGVQFLPGSKGKQSIDQRLKHIDYLNAYGRGFNPMMHSVMNKPLGHHHEDDQLKADMPSGSNEDSAEDDEERRHKKHVVR